MGEGGEGEEAFTEGAQKSSPTGVSMGPVLMSQYFERPNQGLVLCWGLLT